MVSTGFLPLAIIHPCIMRHLMGAGFTDNLTTLKSIRNPFKLSAFQDRRLSNFATISAL
jgi:hypothetical protein